MCVTGAMVSGSLAPTATKPLPKPRHSPAAAPVPHAAPTPGPAPCTGPVGKRPAPTPVERKAV